MAEYFLQLAPPDERSESSRYYHNNIDQRPNSEEERQRCKENGWEIDDDPACLQAWRDLGASLLFLNSNTREN